MTRLARLVAIIACISASHDSHAFRRPQASPTAWQLGGRYDDTRIVVMIGGDINMPQSEAHALQPAFPATRADRFGAVNELSEARAKDIVNGAAHIGDRWVLDAGRFGWFHLTVERFIVADWECAVEWGVMASVVPEERAAFARVSDNHFAVTPATGFTTPARTTSAGPIAFSPSHEHRAALEQFLNAEFSRRWPEVHAEAMQSRAGFGGLRAWPDAWAAIDRRIESGEAKLTYDLQSFRMTPDGEPRLFVRASWKLGSQVVFLMSAWARAGSSLSIDYVDVNVSRNRGYAEFPSSATDIAEVTGVILSVLDTDRNGWGEFILMRRDSGHDAMSIDLFEYPQAAVQELRVILNVNLSC